MIEEAAFDIGKVSDLKDIVSEWTTKINTVNTGSDDIEKFLDKWEQIKGTGITALCGDEAYGGLGLDLVSTMEVLESFGAGCEDAGFSFGVSSHIVSTLVPLQRFGSETQKRERLPDICSGERICAHAISETESGSDAWSMKTKAQKNGVGYILNGSKTFTTNGPVADTIVVYARTNDKAGALGGFSAFLIDKDMKGFTTSKPTEKMGLHCSTLCELYFDDVRVPMENRLGKEGQGFSIFNYVMKWEILLSFIINVGEMETLLKKCIDYGKLRKQYGKPITQYQAISHKIANMKIAIETSRTMLYKAARKVRDRRGDTTIDLAIAKIITSESFVQSSLDAMQIFGGYGYMKESGIERYLRNSVASKIYSGTSEVQRNTIASMLDI